MTLPRIMVAPTGARRGQADHPALPLIIPAIVETAAACHAAGADAIHLHVRDEHGMHSLDPGRYAEASSEIARAVPAMGIQISTEAGGRYDVAAQLACLKRLRPRAASISVREMARDEALAARVYAMAEDTGTEVQHILYDAHDAARLIRWRKCGVIRPGQTDVICVLGRYGNGPASDPERIAPFVAELPQGSRWMLCAFGPEEHSCLIRAARLGGNVRVGFENSLHAPSGHLWPSNAASVLALVAGLDARRITS